MKNIRRPQNLSPDELMSWIKENKCEVKNDCWLWTGPTSNTETPMVYYEGKQHTIYRLFWEFKNKKIFPEELQAGHTCEDSGYNHNLCINPDHIIPVTQRENEYQKKINQEGVNEYKEKQRETQLFLRTQKNKIIPSNLSHEERVDWILQYDTEEDSNGCLIYTRQIGRDGYGRRNINFNCEDSNQSLSGKKKISMHRYIYFIKNNIDYINTGIDTQVQHNCPVGGKPNKACVNPKHMKIGNRAENSMDTRDYHKGTLLSADVVEDILETYLTLYKDKDFIKEEFYRNWVQILEEEGTVISKHAVGNLFRKNRNYWSDIKEKINFEERLWEVQK